jgi:hypothetical protein
MDERKEEVSKQNTRIRMRAKDDELKKLLLVPSKPTIGISVSESVKRSAKK